VPVTGSGAVLCVCSRKGLLRATAALQKHVFPLLELSDSLWIMGYVMLCGG